MKTIPHNPQSDAEIQAERLLDAVNDPSAMANLSAHDVHVVLATRLAFAMFMLGLAVKLEVKRDPHC